MAYRQDARPEVSPLEAAIEPYLGSDEVIRWVAPARRGIVFRRADMFLIPFSLFWGGGAILWQVMALAAGVPKLFACFGMPFVLVGLYLIAGRFLLDMYRRKHTIYAITGERLLVLERNTLKAFALDKLAEVTLHERGDGSGRITIGKAPIGFEVSGAKATVLEIAEDVREVYRTILDAQVNAQVGVRARVEVEEDEVSVEEDALDDEFFATGDR